MTPLLSLSRQIRINRPLVANGHAVDGGDIRTNCNWSPRLDFSGADRHQVKSREVSALDPLAAYRGRSGSRDCEERRAADRPRRSRARTLAVARPVIFPPRQGYILIPDLPAGSYPQGLIASPAGHPSLGG